jgi:hypothetical protein
MAATEEQVRAELEARVAARLDATGIHAEFKVAPSADDISKARKDVGALTDAMVEAQTDSTQKLIWALERIEIGKVGNGALDELFAQISPLNLGIILGVAGGSFIVAQLTPVGWIADVIAAGSITAAIILRGLTLVQILDYANAIGTAISEAEGAKNVGQLDDAARKFAEICGKLPVDLLMMLFGGKSKGGLEPSPKAEQLVAVVTHDGEFAIIDHSTIPGNDLSSLHIKEPASEIAAGGGKGSGRGSGRGGGDEPPGSDGHGNGDKPRQFPDHLLDYVKRLCDKYPKLREARLRPVARSEGEQGAAMEATLTGSISRLEADWAARKSGKIEFDDINEEGKIIDVKDRETGREYKYEARERPDANDPPQRDVVDHITSSSSAPRERPPYLDRLSEKDEVQLTDQVNFAKAHGLTGVEWRTTSDEYAKLVQQAIDARSDWKGFVTVEFMGR